MIDVGIKDDDNMLTYVSGDGEACWRAITEVLREYRVYDIIYEQKGRLDIQGESLLHTCSPVVIVQIDLMFH